MPRLFCLSLVSRQRYTCSGYFDCRKTRENQHGRIQKNMDKAERRVILPCDCGCCMFVINKTEWANGDISYHITVQDSRYDHDFNTFWGRLKRAAKALFGQPVYFNHQCHCRRLFSFIARKISIDRIGIFC